MDYKNLIESNVFSSPNKVGQWDPNACKAILELAWRVEEVEKERDAAIRDLYIAKCCDTCGNQYTDNCILEHCMDACNTIQGENTSYIWRGI